MSDINIPWAEKQEGGGYLVGIPKLMFSIQLSELCMAEILHKCDKDGNKATLKELEETYNAQIANLRRCDKLTCVRAAYRFWFNGKGSTRENYPQRWKAAWDYVKFYFDVVDLKTEDAKE